MRSQLKDKNWPKFGCSIPQKLRKSAKLDKTRKLWYLLSRKFWPLFPKTKFQRVDWRIVCLFTHPIWRFFLFPNLLIFLYLLILKSLGNSWANLYTEFTILDIKYRFSSGELNFHRSTLNYKDIMLLVLDVY